MPLRLATRAMGTRFELVLAGDDEPRLRAAGEEALYELEEADRRLSLFRRDSLLAHVLRTAPREPVRLDQDTFDLFALCARVYAESGGAFDPSVAPLMRALGLHGDGSQAPALDLAAARSSVGLDALELDAAARTVRFARPDLALDLGGVAKGHALDLAARALREHGVERALLHGGTSTVLALGPPPGASAWRVRVGGGEDAPVAELTDVALAVSARHGRKTATHHHVLDPATGTSSRGADCAAVLAPGAALADAWSTALLVRGDALDPAAMPGLESLYQLDPPDHRSPHPWQHRGPLSGRFVIPSPAASR